MNNSLDLHSYLLPNIALYAWCKRYHCERQAEEMLRSGYEESEGKGKLWTKHKDRNRVRLVNDFPDREYSELNKGAEILHSHIEGLSCDETWQALETLWDSPGKFY